MESPNNGSIPASPDTNNSTVIINQDVKIQSIALIPTFSGDKGLNEFFKHIESIANVAAWEDADKVKITILKLSGKAAQYADINKLDTKDYATLKKAIVKRFTTEDDHFSSLQQFINCHQLFNESVDDYALRLQTLASRVTKQYESDQQQITENERIESELLAKFMAGLNSQIRALVSISKPQTLEAAIETAREMQKLTPPVTSILKANPTDEGHHVNYKETGLLSDSDSDREVLSDRANQGASADVNNRRSRRPIQQSRSRGQSPANHQRSPQRRSLHPGRAWTPPANRNPRDSRYSLPQSFRQWRSPAPGPMHPCFECGGTNHWANTCYYRQQSRNNRAIQTSPQSGNVSHPSWDRRGPALRFSRKGTRKFQLKNTSTNSEQEISRRTFTNKHAPAHTQQWTTRETTEHNIQWPIDKVRNVLQGQEFI